MVCLTLCLSVKALSAFTSSSPFATVGLNKCHCWAGMPLLGYATVGLDIMPLKGHATVGLYASVSCIFLGEDRFNNPDALNRVAISRLNSQPL